MSKPETKVFVTYEYSDGAAGVKTFFSHGEAMLWVNNEGDHLVDYSLFFS